MRTRLPLASITLALCLGVASATQAATMWHYGDTLTTIQRPLPNLPALARPGDTFTVWASAPSTAAGWSASLQYGARNVPLAPAGGGWQPTKSRWELQYTVPPGTPEEVYALLLASDSTNPDTAMHAVRVLKAYLNDYYFAQISDTHLPEHAFSTTTIDTTDTTGMADFDAVIEDLNVIHPEFIVHTGDLVNEGELEEWFRMYEMGRAQGMLNHLDAPVWVTSGNHDIGGWKPTTPPDGTSRKNWWRYYGWKWLENPPAGDPVHSQDITFDYGPLHLIGLEAYINNGSYDSYRTDLWGAQSFTPEQMTWLQNDIAAQPPGTHQLVFYHYDFGGTNPNGTPGANFSQINVNTLGVDGAIWGHNHVVAEDRNTARSAHPFDLGCRSVIDYRCFRIFRVSNGVITPGPMHFSSTLSSRAVDSLGVSWTGPNDGTRSANTVTVLNRFGEAWDHARVRFNLADHDSSFTATGGTIAQVLRQGGMANVLVDCVVPAGGTIAVTVQASAPVAGVDAGRSAFGLRAPGPNPFHPSGGARLLLHFGLPARSPVRLEAFDLGGRRVTTLLEGSMSAGEHDAAWDGRDAAGAPVRPAIYLVRLTAGASVQTRRVAILD
jgi:3',5'-cyclic AMP phosphodiesterase CpdA